jgi:hypothetical protein
MRRWLLALHAGDRGFKSDGRVKISDESARHRRRHNGKESSPSGNQKKRDSDRPDGRKQRGRVILNFSR